MSLQPLEVFECLELFLSNCEKFHTFTARENAHSDFRGNFSCNRKDPKTI